MVGEISQEEWDNMSDEEKEQLMEVAKRYGKQKQQAPQKMECIFCKIIKNEIPTKVVFASENFIAFLDIQPKTVGHIVIVSKRHVATFLDLNAKERAELLDAVTNICTMLREKLKATGYSLISSNGISSGQSLEHFSLHILPTYSVNAVDLPILSIIQPAKVPPFVMEEVDNALRIDKRKGGREFYFED